MEQIKIEILGEQYILVEEIQTVGNTQKLNKKVKQVDGIFQGVKEINEGSFWSSIKAFAIVKILIPEKNILIWNRLNMNG